MGKRFFGRWRSVCLERFEAFVIMADVETSQEGVWSAGSAFDSAEMGMTAGLAFVGVCN